jgi:hypothetical protein
MRVETAFGKFFLIFYLLFGLPLAQICLIDMAHLLIYLLKFFYSFLLIMHQRSTFYSDLKQAFYYYLSLLNIFNRFNRNENGRQRDSSRRVSKLSRFGYELSESEDNDNENSQGNKKSLLKKEATKQEGGGGAYSTLNWIYDHSVQELNSKFDFSSSFVFGFMFFYLILGSFFIFKFEHRAGDNDANFIDSLSERLYSAFRAMNRISFDSNEKTLQNSDKNDNEIAKLILPIIKKDQNRKTIIDAIHESSFIFVLHSAYLLFGVAFFSLAIKSMREKLRTCLIENGKRLVIEFLKWAQQFGFYEPNLHSDYSKVCVYYVFFLDLSWFKGGLSLAFFPYFF